MKRVLIVLFLLLLPQVYAQIESYNNVSVLTAQINISSSLERTSGSVVQLSTTLNFFPKNYTYQTLLSQEFHSSPEAQSEESSDDIQYSWESTSDSYSYSVLSTVQMENTLIKVSQKVAYPVSIPDDVKIYTVPTDKIDITPEINTLAEQIVDGEDDAYKAVFLLANWTQANIVYNLSTINIQANEKSSYVLEHKEGVCDELTNLFISLVRSRGIPARFVSGLVYSNEGYTFGPHGWAEVYIDDQWIPVDVTFGTFGWVDPSHIKFKEEYGSNTASVSYSGIGKDLTVHLGEVGTNAQVLSYEGTAQQYVSLSVSPLVDAVGPGSYVPIQIQVSNDNDFYVPVQLEIINAPGVVGSNTKSVLLQPREEKSVFWILSVPENINPAYVYETFVRVQSMYGGIAETNFSYGESYPVINKSNAEAQIAALNVAEGSLYLDDVSLSCSTEKNTYYTNESATVTCLVGGNFDGASVCFENQCLDARKKLQWTKTLEGSTSQRLFVSAEKNGKKRYSYFDLQILQEPKLRIQHFAPTSIGFYENGTLSFDLVTDSPIQNITISVDPIGTFTLPSLQAQKHISYSFTGKDIKQGKMVFHMEYVDILGKKYNTEQEEGLVIENIPWYYQIYWNFLSFFS